jgi:hypothetical protein
MAGSSGGKPRKCFYQEIHQRFWVCHVVRKKLFHFASDKTSWRKLFTPTGIQKPFEQQKVWSARILMALQPIDGVPVLDTDLDFPEFSGKLGSNAVNMVLMIHSIRIDPGWS